MIGSRLFEWCTAESASESNALWHLRSAFRLQLISAPIYSWSHVISHFTFAFSTSLGNICYIRGHAGGGAGGPTSGQLGSYFWFSLQTYPLQKSKHLQERDIFKISNAFPVIRGSNFSNFLGRGMSLDPSSLPLFTGSHSAPSPLPPPLQNVLLPRFMCWPTNLHVVFGLQMLTVSLHASTRKYSIKLGVLDKERGVAYGTYEDTLNSTG